jgi:hypothetical protein
MTDLCNAIISEGKIPSDWKSSVLIPVYKGKGDPMDCSSYRGIKLLEHAMKVLERVLAKRIREQVTIDDMQFGFRPGKGTTDAIFIVRQLQEKHQAKRKNLFYAFVDLEKAFDRVPREVTRWALRKSGVEEWLVEAVMAMYVGAETAVRTTAGVSEGFDVKVGLHQGSVLSPLLFIIVMDVIGRETREGLPWELLYADDLVLIAKSEKELKRKIQRWKTNMEAKGMKVNVGKTKVMVGTLEKTKPKKPPTYPCGVCRQGVGRFDAIVCTQCGKWVHRRCSDVVGSLKKVKDTFVCRRCLGTEKDADIAKEEITDTEKNMDLGNGVSLELVDKFCYLGDMLSADGGADAAVAARVSSAWKKFRELTPFLTAKRVSLKMKGKVYDSCVRTCMTYGSETWAMKAGHESKLETADMRMIRWMCGVSLRDRKSSADLRDMIGVRPIKDVCRQNRLRWFGHVERKDDDDWVKRCSGFVVEGKRPVGRPSKSWNEVLREDLRELGLVPEEAQDRKLWRRKIHGCKPADPGKSG